MNLSPFSAAVKTVSVAASAVATASAALPSSGNQIRLMNEGPNVAFIAIGSGAQTATLPAATAGASTVTSVPVPVGDVTLTIDSSAVLNFSVVCRAAQTAQVNIQVGEGA